MNPTRLPLTRGRSRLVRAVLVGVLALSHVPPAAGQSRCWTTVGSAGTVDEADTGVVSLNLSNVTIKPSVTQATLNVRYNVVATEGLFGGDRIGMGVRYVDNGGRARVVVRLKEVNLQTGVSTVRMSFDSNAFPPAPGPQTQFVSDLCGSGSFFDFTTHAYYLDVELTKSGVGGAPMLQAINICITFC